VRIYQNYLKVRNRIYDHVFNRQWVSTHMPDAELRRQRRAFRLGLLRASGVFALVLISAGALFGFYRVRTARAELERENLTSAITQQTMDRLRNLLGTQRPALQLTREFMQEPTYGIGPNMAAFDPRWRERAKMLLRVLRAYPDLNIVHFGDYRGNFTGAHREAGGRFMVNHRWLAQGKTRRIAFYVNKEGRWQPIREEHTRFFDPRRRPWYQKAVQQKTFVWTAPYLFHGGYLGITAAQPLNSKRQIAGVIGIDFRLSQLQSVIEQVSKWQPDGHTPRVLQASRGTALRQVTTSPQNQVFILTSDGYRLAGTDALKGTGQSKRSRPDVLFAPGSQSPNPILRTATHQYLQRRKSGRNGIPNFQLNFRVGGTYYRGVWRPLNLGDLHWIVIVVVPTK
jgi:hypothetical protein